MITSKECPGLPAQYELVRIGTPKKGESFIANDDKDCVITATVDWACSIRPIVRKIEPQPIEPGEGWSCVQSNEIVIAGKKFIAHTLKPNQGEGWRLLDEHEKIQSGDLIHHHSLGWEPANLSIGLTVRSSEVRRRIEQPLQLREGGWYERRDGKVFGPCKPYNHRVYHWIVDGIHYDDNGRFLASDSKSNLLDLIREVPPPFLERGTTLQPTDEVQLATGQWKQVDWWPGRRVEGGRFRRMKA